MFNKCSSMATMTIFNSQFHEFFFLNLILELQLFAYHIINNSYNSLNLVSDFYKSSVLDIDALLQQILLILL